MCQVMVCSKPRVSIILNLRRWLCLANFCCLSPPTLLYVLHICPFYSSADVTGTQPPMPLFLTVNSAAEKLAPEPCRACAEYSWACPPRQVLLTVRLAVMLGTSGDGHGKALTCFLISLEGPVHPIL